MKPTLKENKMWPDPIVEEIRQIREAYAAQFNYDLDAIYADIQRQQKESGREYVSLPWRRPNPQSESNPQSEGEPAETLNSL